MAAPFAVIRQAALGTTGTQTFTSPGFGTPKAAIFKVTWGSTDGVTDQMSLNVGVTDGTLSGTHSICSRNGQTESTSHSRFSDKPVVVARAVNGLVNGEAEFSQWVTDGVEINWTDATTAGFIIECILLQCEYADVHRVTSSGTLDAAVNVSGIGFRPDSLFVLASGPTYTALPLPGGTADDGAISLGYVDFAPNDSVTQVCVHAAEPNGEALGGNLRGIIESDRGARSTIDSSTLSVGVDFSAPASGGYTITTRDAAQSLEMTVLAVKWGTDDHWAGVVDGPTGIGDWSVTDPGFQPAGLQMLPHQLPVTDTLAVTSLTGVIGTYSTDGTNEASTGVTSSFTADPTDTASFTEDSCFLPFQAGGTAFDGTLSSFDPTGWTINFSTAQSGKKWLALAVGEVPDPQPGVSDDFNRANLNTDVWTFVDPLGDCSIRMTGTGTSDAALELEVPEGTEHVVWETLTAPHVVQPIDDGDFRVEVKFDSLMSQRYQGQGLVVLGGPNDRLRFDIYWDNGYQTFAASIINNSASVEGGVTITPDPTTSMWIAVQRTGDSWVQEHSLNGTDWTQSTSFSQVFDVESVGVYALNSTYNSNTPGHTAVVDYFEVTSDPITSEDGSVAGDTLPPFVHGVDDVLGHRTIQVLWNTDELATGVVEYGTTTAYELGSVAASTAAYNQRVALVGLDPNTTYHYRITATATGGSTVDVDRTATTLDEAGSYPLIDLWYGQTPKFGNIGEPQNWMQIQANVTSSGGVGSVVSWLNGANAVLLDQGPNNRRLENAGDVVAEYDFTDLVDGVNEVRLVATDGTNGSLVTEEVVKLTYTSGNTWPLPFTANWGTSSRIDDVAQVVDGKWQISGSEVEILETGYDRIIAIGDGTAWGDYEVECPITINSIPVFPANPAAAPGPLAGLLLRWQGHTDSGDQLAQGWDSLGTIAGYFFPELDPPRLELWDSGSSTVVDNSGKTLTAGTTYIFKARVESTGAGTADYSFKVWEQGTSEPGTWDLTSSTTGDLDNGCLLLLLHYVDASIGQVEVTTLSATTTETGDVLVGEGSLPAGAETVTDSGAVLQAEGSLPSGAAEVAELGPVLIGEGALPGGESSVEDAGGVLGSEGVLPAGDLSVSTRPPGPTFVGEGTLPGGAEEVTQEGAVLQAEGQLPEGSADAVVETGDVLIGRIRTVSATVEQSRQGREIQGQGTLPPGVDNTTILENGSVLEAVANLPSGNEEVTQLGDVFIANGFLTSADEGFVTGTPLSAEAFLPGGEAQLEDQGDVLVGRGELIFRGNPNASLEGSPIVAEGLLPGGEDAVADSGDPLVARGTLPQGLATTAGEVFEFGAVLSAEGSLPAGQEIGEALEAQGQLPGGTASISERGAVLEGQGLLPGGSEEVIESGAPLVAEGVLPLGATSMDAVVEEGDVLRSFTVLPQGVDFEFVVSNIQRIYQRLHEILEEGPYYHVHYDVKGRMNLVSNVPVKPSSIALQETEARFGDSRNKRSLRFAKTQSAWLAYIDFDVPVTVEPFEKKWLRNPKGIPRDTNNDLDAVLLEFDQAKYEHPVFSGSETGTRYELSFFATPLEG